MYIAGNALGQPNHARHQHQTNTIIVDSSLEGVKDTLLFMERVEESFHVTEAFTRSLSYSVFVMSLAGRWNP